MFCIVKTSFEAVHLEYKILQVNNFCRPKVGTDLPEMKINFMRMYSVSYDLPEIRHFSLENRILWPEVTA